MFFPAVNIAVDHIHLVILKAINAYDLHLLAPLTLIARQQQIEQIRPQFIQVLPGKEAFALTRSNRIPL
jgi:hypothetical protein